MSKAAELREEAIAEFKAADALVEGDEGPKDEHREQFEAHMTKGTELMNDWRKAAQDEGNVVTVRGALEEMAGAVRPGSGPIPWRAVDLPIAEASGKTLGQLFIESQAYKDLTASGVLASDRASFKSAPFTPEQKAATDILYTTTGGTGAALVTPQYLPGALGLPQRPLTVRELFSQGQATSDLISYARQSAFDDATAAVAQAVSAVTGAKPQSSIAWTRQTSPVETIATWMAATRQQLADANQVRALIDNQLRLMLSLEEEDQLMSGSGTSPNLRGLNNVSGIQLLDLTAATSTGDPNLDGVRNAMRLVRTGASRLTADGIVVHPTDSMEFDLLVDNQGQYRIGDPFAYNAGGQPRPIWGLRRVESEAVAAGTAWVGGFRGGATVLERQGITILTADQHADFFIRNLIVVLAEERLGFPVFFPTAFVKITLKAW